MRGAHHTAEPPEQREGKFDWKDAIHFQVQVCLERRVVSFQRSCYLINLTEHLLTFYLQRRQKGKARSTGRCGRTGYLMGAHLRDDRWEVLVGSTWSWSPCSKCFHQLFFPTSKNGRVFFCFSFLAQVHDISLISGLGLCVSVQSKAVFSFGAAGHLCLWLKWEVTLGVSGRMCSVFNFIHRRRELPVLI